jgi:hypothetical protein
MFWTSRRGRFAADPLAEESESVSPVSAASAIFNSTDLSQASIGSIKLFAEFLT